MTNDEEAMGNLLYGAWGLIANASEGNWFNETDEWRTAAIRWRDQYHTYLDESYRTMEGQP